MKKIRKLRRNESNFRQMNVLKGGKYACICIFLSVMLFGCRFLGSQKPKAGDLPVIDVSKTYPKKEIRLQDIADIEYIPLETTDDVLLDRTVLSYLSDKYIIAHDFCLKENGF